jgi:hypothetical protein
MFPALATFFEYSSHRTAPARGSNRGRRLLGALLPVGMGGAPEAVIRRGGRLLVPRGAKKIVKPLASHGGPLPL